VVEVVYHELELEVRCPVLPRHRVTYLRRMHERVLLFSFWHCGLFVVIFLANLLFLLLFYYHKI